MDFGLILAAACLLDLVLGDPQGWPHPHPLPGLAGQVLGGPSPPAGHMGRGAFLAGLYDQPGPDSPGPGLGASASCPFGGLPACKSSMAWTCLAMRALHRETALAEKALLAGDLAGARHWLSRVVSRRTESLDAPQIRRGLLETIAENLSDGVVAPLFWGLVGGLPGMFLYKGVNTLDSMVGYRTPPRYNLFGRLAARVDDATNFLPARLTALLLVVLAAPLGGDAARAGRGPMLADHAKAASPNAGLARGGPGRGPGRAPGRAQQLFRRSGEQAADQPGRLFAWGRRLSARGAPAPTELPLSAAALAALGLHAAGAGFGGLVGLLF